MSAVGKQESMYLYCYPIAVFVDVLLWTFFLWLEELVDLINPMDSSVHNPLDLVHPFDPMDLVGPFNIVEPISLLDMMLSKLFDLQRA